MMHSKHTFSISGNKQIITESRDDNNIDKEILEFNKLIITFFRSNVFVNDSSFIPMCDNVDKDENRMAKGDAAINEAPVVDLTLQCMYYTDICVMT